MAKISLIAAIGKNNELGKDNNLIWRLKGDLQFFKETTMNHKIVMGYNTFKSLPKLLPGREHIILSHQNIKIDGALVFHNMDDLISYLSNINETVYVIGGGMIYSSFIDIADELILTEIDGESYDADVYFPKFNRDDYIRKVVSEKEENGIRYRHIQYSKVPKNLIQYDEFLDDEKKVTNIQKIKKYNK